jgi:hypothetical protein
MTELDVTQRLDHPERENRRLKQVGTLSLWGAILAIILLGQPAIAQVTLGHAPILVLPDGEKWRTLAGIKTIHVSVRLPKDEDNWLSASTLQTDVELKLRQAGIGVVGRDKPADAWLTLEAFTSRAYGDSYVYSMTLGLRSAVVLVRDPKIAVLAPTFEAGSVLGLGRPAQARDAVKDLVDKFLNSYLMANHH